MQLSFLFKAACLTGLLSLAGCSSSVTAPEKYSGFLKDYSGLKKTESRTGKPILRWVSPDYKPGSYDTLVFNPLTYYPKPKPNSQLGHETLDKILTYTNSRLKERAAEKIELVSTPGPRSLIFRGAITGVNSSAQDIQFYEVVPIAMVVAGTMMLTGHRTMDTHIYFEGELIDANTNKVVMKVLRKGQGKKIDNENALITIDDIKGVIDELATDTALEFTPPQTPS
ncbi:DUF3313 domain-containing protein [Enterobacteriaceae bacterium H16N7]|nr:DUF3313 domain-containing protein [Dryocola clanedunensis]